MVTTERLVKVELCDERLLQIQQISHFKIDFRFKSIAVFTFIYIIPKFQRAFIKTKISIKISQFIHEIEERKILFAEVSPISKAASLASVVKFNGEALIFFDAIE